MTGRRRFGRFVDTLFAAGEARALTLELVYGHCWGTGGRRPGGDVVIDAGRIPVRRQ